MTVSTSGGHSKDGGISEMDLLFVACTGGFWVVRGDRGVPSQDLEGRVHGVGMGAFFLWFYTLLQSAKLYGPPISG